MTFSSLQIEKVCRTCLKESVDGMRSVFSIDETVGENVRLCEMLMSCAAVQVCDDDGLPSQVCLQCVHNINRTFSFKQLCERSDATLRQLLASSSESKAMPANEFVGCDVKMTPQITDNVNNDLVEFIKVECDLDESEEINSFLNCSDDDDDDGDDDSHATTTSTDEDMKSLKKIKTEKVNDYVDYTEQPIYLCEQCSKCFTTQEDLKIHSRTHRIITKHICKICKQGFFSRSTLHRHMKVHDGSEHNMMLDATENSYTSLTEHSRRHTDAKSNTYIDGGKSEMLEEIETSTSPRLCEEIELTSIDLLPEKSKAKYRAAYEAFMAWRKKNETSSDLEQVLMAYFRQLHDEKKAPSSLWSIFSMLKKMILLEEKEDIGKYLPLRTYLKSLSVGFEPKQSSVFDKDQVSYFLRTAPDETYLAMKVALIIGIMGGCTSQEIADLQIQNVKEEGKLLVVTLPKTRSNKKRRFVITEEYVKLVKRYMELRPQNPELKRFFFGYRNGKCSNQVIGVHTIAKMPVSIAEYLKLENPTSFTGHCFRRTSTTIFANAGEYKIMELKELGESRLDNEATQ